MARLDRLSPIKEVAQIGSAIGREFSYKLLAAVAPHKDAQLEATLEQLVDAGLVFRRGERPHGSFILAAHPLVLGTSNDRLVFITTIRRSTRSSRNRASIGEFGFTNPVLIDEEDGIIAGHGRVRAAH